MTAKPEETPNAFLADDALRTVTMLRNPDEGYEYSIKSGIADAITIIYYMMEYHAGGTEKEELLRAIGTLTRYNELVTELCRDKE